MGVDRFFQKPSYISKSTKNNDLAGGIRLLDHFYANDHSDYKYSPYSSSGPRKDKCAKDDHKQYIKNYGEIRRSVQTL